MADIIIPVANDDEVVKKSSIVNDLTTGGITNVLSAEQGKQLFLELQDALDLKADKAQEAWITPTLINGWTASTYPVSYFKDSLGFVHLKGFATGGTLDSIIFNFPTEYRPKQVLYLMAYANYAEDGVAAKISISTGGQIKIFRSNVNVSLDNISFYVGV